MKLTENQVRLLQNALEVTKLMGVETVMISEGKVRGAKESRDAAIISELDIGLPNNISIGVGRVDELLARIAAFDAPTIDITTNADNDASSLTIRAERTKLDFRCTSSRMIRFPKTNTDDPAFKVTLTAAEVKLLTKAINIMASEHVVFQLSRNGQVKVEAADAVRDRFEMVLENDAQAIGEEESFVFTYLAKLLAKALSGASTGDKPVTLIFGESGSVSMAIKDHNVVVIAQLNDEDEDF